MYACGGDNIRGTLIYKDVVNGCSGITTAICVGRSGSLLTQRSHKLNPRCACMPRVNNDYIICGKKDVSYFNTRLEGES